MSRWDDDVYEEPRRGERDERGYGSRDGLQGSGRREWTPEEVRGRGRRRREARYVEQGELRPVERYGHGTMDMGRRARRYGAPRYGDVQWEEEQFAQRYPPAVERWDGENFDQRYPDSRWDGSQYGIDPSPAEQRRIAEEDRRREGPYTGRGPRGWTASNERVQEQVCERMAHHSHLDASDIEVTVDDCEVTLEGTVPNRLQKRLAEDIADRVPGVRDVHNRLTVQRQTETERRKAQESPRAPTRAG